MAVTMLSINATALETTFKTIVDSRREVKSHLGRNIILSIASLDTVSRDEDVEEARYDECTDDQDDNNVHEDKAVDERGVISVVVEELGVGKREHQCDSGTGDVLETDWPDPVDFPVLTTIADGTVEILAELVARVEGCVPEAAEDGIVAPESGSWDSWGFAHERSNESTSDEDAKAYACTSGGAHEVAE
jgi:hypothetical protein